VDDIGLSPVSQDAAEGLYRLVDAAYEKRSVALSSDLHPAAFDELMPKTLATASTRSCTTRTSARQTWALSSSPPRILNNRFLTRRKLWPLVRSYYW
jgi:hypothetical protein